MGLLYYVVLIVALLISNSGMLVFVVMEGVELSNYQYSFAFILSLSSAVAYFFMGLFGKVKDKITNERQVSLNPFAGLKRIYRFEIGGLLGLLWAMNYVFLLQANPFTSGVVQIIFNEMNIVVTMAGSTVLLGKRYHPLQIVAGFLLVGGGLIPLIKGSTSIIHSNIPFWVWYLIYLLGTIPIAVANVITEKIVKMTDDKERGPVNEDAPLLPQPRIKTFKVRISQLFFVSNLWTCVFVLAFFWVPGLAVGDKMWTQFLEGNKCIITFCNRGSYWVWVASLLSWIGTWCTASLTREDDVTIASIITTIAPFLSSIVMGVKKIFGIYYTPILWTDWLALGIMSIALILYKAPALRKQTGVNHYPYRKRLEWMDNVISE